MKAWECLAVAVLLWDLCCGYAPLRVRVLDLSSQQIPYRTAWQWQESIAQHHILQQPQDPALPPAESRHPFAGSLLLLQHPPTYTLGTSSEETGGPFRGTDSSGNALEYEVLRSDRAGQTTYHGPGQLVCYPILDLNFFERDIHKYLRNLEQTIISTLQEFGIESGRVPGFTGVWVGDKKLAAIGIRIQRWVTMHGVALNVNPNLAYFDNIIPCGIRGKQVGSMQQFLRDIQLRTVKDVVLAKFGRVFNCETAILPTDEAEAFIRGLPQLTHR